MLSGNNSNLSSIINPNWACYFGNYITHDFFFHFSPDNLASTASSSLVWLILEIGLIYLTLTVMSINTTLAKWDILSFSCYKYVGVITVLVIGGYSSLTYYLTLAYVSSALFFFLLRTLRLRIEPEVSINKISSW